ncbi:hypothetical protein FHT87_004616 [Rhizobium sp. BK316]|nr:hypothetical protein [Rhizobium sp. BK316]
MQARGFDCFAVHLEVIVNLSHPSSGEKLRSRIEKLLILAADCVDAVGPAAEPWLVRLELEYRAALRPSAHDRVAALIAEGQRHG